LGNYIDDRDDTVLLSAIEFSTSNTEGLVDMSITNNLIDGLVDMTITNNLIDGLVDMSITNNLIDEMFGWLQGYLRFMRW
jgi:hypothetical protein